MGHRLHPNLAKLAVAYDDILARYERKQLTAENARREVMQLVARDDQGVQWHLSPDTGQWHRRTIDGKLVADAPPSYGVETASAHDISNGDPFRNPRPHLSFEEVDGSGDESALPGATLRAARVMSGDENRHAITLRVAAVLCALLILGGVLILVVR